MQLFKNDFANDKFLSFVPFVTAKEEKRKIFLTYRITKYAVVNKFDSEKLHYPTFATQIFQKEFSSQIKVTISHIEALLLDYVIDCSNILTINDIEMMYSAKTYNLLNMLTTMDCIIKSRAKITAAKQSKYKLMFSKDAIAIKAAEVIAELRALKLVNAKGFPTKVFSRYLPIFDAYPEIGDIVASELKHWLLQKVKAAQQLSQKEYNLTVGDLYKYFSIVNDERLKSKKFKFVRDLE